MFGLTNKYIILVHALLLWPYMETMSQKNINMNIGYQLRQTISIGTVSEEPSENILIYPRFITTNSVNDIFIADIGILGIKVFNRNSNCSTTIGRIGDGPGEFRDITAMTTNQNDELVVVDYLNKRFSVFDSNCNFKTSYRIPTNIMWPRIIACASNGDYYILAKHTTKDLRIHRFNKDFQKVHSFLKLPIINENDNDRQFEKSLSSVLTGNIMISSSNKLYYIPGIYSGKIYVFENDRLEKVLQSKREFVKFYEYKFMSKRPKDPRPSKYTIMKTSREGTYWARTNYISGGMNMLDNGTIAHLLISFSNQKYEIGIELFTENESTYKYVKLNGDELPYYNWSSNSGKWYLIDRREIPIIKEFILKKE